MLNFKKKYDEGMVAGIRSFQKRVNEVSDSINSSYELVNERLDQFDKIKRHHQQVWVNINQIV